MLALIIAGVVLVGVLVAGVVLIATGGDGGGESKSLKTDYRAPQAFNLDNVYSEEEFTCGSRDTTCVRHFLVSVTSRYGPRASLPVLERLQQERRVDPSVNDHDLAHAVGRETAKDFGSNFKSFDLCPTIFNYGCPHGFFEYVLARTDTPKQAATSICESLGGANRLLIAGFTCYHGVGHGVMMAEAYDLQGSLAACNTLGKREAKDGCWQGVFMENVNAGMTGRARKGVFTRQNPLAPCDKIANQYKHECFINHAGWLMIVAGNRVEKATGFCLKAQAGNPRSACMQSIGLMVTNPVWQATLSPNAGKRPQEEIAADLCSRFPAAGRTDCVTAGVDNLANFDQLDVGRQRAFCAEVATTQTSACYRQVGVNLRARTKDEQVIRGRCRELPAASRNACVRGAGLSA
jgi:hypothetical protein